MIGNPHGCGGWAVVVGVHWARIPALARAMASIPLMILWLAYYPRWSIPVIALSAMAVWAIAHPTRHCVADRSLVTASTAAMATVNLVNNASQSHHRPADDPMDDRADRCLCAS